MPRQKLPAGTVENLLKPENKQQLVDFLTYHVVLGHVMAVDVVKLDEAETGMRAWPSPTPWCEHSEGSLALQRGDKVGSLQRRRERFEITGACRRRDDVLF